jgi:hypothetical protein
MKQRSALPSLPPLAILPCLLFLASCIPDPRQTLPLAFDLRPPLLLEAGAEGPRQFVLRFDEEVEAVEGSFALDPGDAPQARTEGRELRLEFGEDQVAGADYSLVGEVRDGGGNCTRFLLGFQGYNDHPARLLINEVQTAKNSSTTRPHRDFVEFRVLASGNLGGLELSASSAVKTVAYRFPGLEVEAGELLVLHCAPEGLASERDELAGELGLSGGVDSSAARDLWSRAGPLPDAGGILVLRSGPGGRPLDGLFYAEIGKSGALGQDRLGSQLTELAEYGLWELGGLPAWEDAFLWKPSTARSILRLDEGGGAASWGLSEASAQGPGLP